MPTIQTSPISFGGYVMPIGTKVKDRTVDSTIDEVPMLGRDGTIAPSGRAAAGLVTLEIDLGQGDTSPFTGNAMWTMDDLNDECNRIYQRLASGYQQLIVGETPVRYSLCQKQRFSITYAEGSGRAHGTIAITFYAQDPRWLLDPPNTITTAASINTTVTNAGSVKTFPVFTFTTAGQVISMSVAPTGAGSGQNMQVNTGHTLAAGETLVIDCDPRTPTAQRLTINGVNRLDLLGTSGLVNTMGDDYLFPYLNPGVNTISGAGCTVTWRDAWGF